MGERLFPEGLNLEYLADKYRLPAGHIRQSVQEYEDRLLLEQSAPKEQYLLEACRAQLEHKLGRDCLLYTSFVLDSSKYELEPFSCMKFSENPYTKDQIVDAFGATYYTVMQLWERYHKPVLVAEAGMSAREGIENGKIHDDYRIEYYRRNFEQLKECILDGAEIIAYCCWGPIDLVASRSSEMSRRYGFVYVDRDDYGNGTQKRIKKDSFYYYQKVIASNGEDLE